MRLECGMQAGRQTILNHPKHPVIRPNIGQIDHAVRGTNLVCAAARVMMMRSAIYWAIWNLITVAFMMFECYLGWRRVYWNRGASYCSARDG